MLFTRVVLERYFLLVCAAQSGGKSTKILPCTFFNLWSLNVSKGEGTAKERLK